MGTKRKPESPLISEPSFKIRRTDTHSDHENSQYAPVAYSPLPQEDAPSPSANSTPAPLTKANLKKLEKMTKSGSKSGKSEYSSKSGKTTTMTTTPSVGVKSLSTTDANFERTFRANGGLHVLDSEDYPPSNEQAIKAYLEQSRRSESPTPSQHRRFRQCLKKTSNERDIEFLFQGRVFKETNKTDELLDIDYGANVDKQWVAYPKNVGFNNGLSAPKPDLVEGYAQRAFPPSINELGGSATLVHDSETFVGLPHFAVEFKDRGKSMHEAEVQTGYDGANMVYSHNKALAFIGDKDPPRHASPMTVATDGHTWTAYAHYAHHNNDTNQLEYYQNDVGSGKTVGYDDFKRSYRMLRNTQDWGRKESDDLRERMRKHEALRAQQASNTSQSGSVIGAKAGTSAKSSASGGGPQASSRRTSDAGSRRSDGQASVASSKSAGRPSMTGYAGTSRLGSNQQITPSASKTMPPPPRRSSDAVSGRAADHRGAARSPSTTRYPPSASSGSRSGAGAPRSSKAPSVDSQQYTDPRHSRPDKYRDRRSDDDIQPVQRRRSDSPQDQPRPPRDMDRGRDRTRDSSRLGDSSRDAGRYARATSVGGSSSGGRYVARRSPSADRYSGR